MTYITITTQQQTKSNTVINLLQLKYFEKKNQ